MNKKITVTLPLLPPLDEFRDALGEIWREKQITNFGLFHEKFESSLREYLKVSNLSLFTNGTTALMSAFRAMHITGEVITTPYSFVATTHALDWMGIKPVFADIEPMYCTIDPEQIEHAITTKTRAILAVHVYGNPCDTERIEAIAGKYNLKVIYDAAHAFGVEVNGKSILQEGDVSIMSFHATKVFNTVEGGALISPDSDTKRDADYLKNFGFEDETTVVMSGINGKMDELRAAYGLICLKYIDAAIKARKSVVETYRSELAGIPGISFIGEIPGVKSNYSYFPIFVDEAEYGISRDELYLKMQADNIFCRRYFYPLITECPAYKNEPSAKSENLPVASHKSSQVICLPVHHELSEDDITRIIRHVCLNKSEK